MKDCELGQLGEIYSPSHVTYNVFVVHNSNGKVTINTYFISGEDVIQLIRRQ